MPSYQSSVPVGTIIDSMLTEAQIQTHYGTGWVLCDGRSVSGSKYESITGNGSIPDARGRFKRGKDNSAGTDPNGDSSLGTTRSSQNLSHQHTVLEGLGGAGGPFYVVRLEQINTGGGTTGGTTPTYTLDSGGFEFIGLDGASDSQPMSLITNSFIKIN